MAVHMNMYNLQCKTLDLQCLRSTTAHLYKRPSDNLKAAYAAFLTISVTHFQLASLVAIYRHSLVVPPLCAQAHK